MLLQSARPLFAASARWYPAAAAASTISVRELTVASLDSIRAVLKLGGDGVLPFLQGLISCDVRPLEKGEAKLLYGALLTPKGKFRNDLFIMVNPEKGSEVFLDVDFSSRSSVLQWLTRYKLRRAISLEDASEALTVYTAFGQGSQTDLSHWPVDPRLPELGRRHIQRAASIQISHEALGAYRQWRVELGVAEGDTEIPTEKANPLEYNLDILHAVDYGKGCYIGQEKQSFTHYRGVIRKRLMPVALEGDPDTFLQVCTGSEVVSGDGTSVGTLRAVYEDRGLAHLRMEHALPAVKGETELTVKGVQGLVVKPRTPSWWPQDWLIDPDRLSEGGKDS